jgi:hypothetical protein
MNYNYDDELFEDAPAEWELENPLDEATREELEARDRARRPVPPPTFEPAREQQRFSEKATARLLAGREPEWEPDHRPPDRELERRMSVSHDA